MGLSIKNEETVRLVRKVADRYGVGLTRAVHIAAEAQLKWDPEKAREDDWQRRLEDIRAIQARVKLLPVIDDRSDDEILGYGDDGLPH